MVLDSPAIRSAEMQVSLTVVSHYFQRIYHQSHELVATLANTCLGFQSDSDSDSGDFLIENCRWAIEDWVLLTLLVIEGMVFGGFGGETCEEGFVFVVFLLKSCQ